LCKVYVTKFWSGLELGIGPKQAGLRPKSDLGGGYNYTVRLQLDGAATI